MDSKPLLLISGGPTTRPLWGLLSETYDLVMLYPAAANEAIGLGLPAAALASVTDGALQDAIQNQAALLSARVVAGLPQIAERTARLYGPERPAPLNGHLGEWFAGYAHQLILGEVAILAQLARLGGAGRRIAGCVTHEDVAPDTRALVAWCNGKGVPTIHVPHAPCHLLPGVADIHRETRTQYIAASGPLAAKFYTDSGFPAANIRLTGAPHWDELYHGALPTRREARAVLAVPDGPCLLYQTTWGQTTSLRSDFEREFEAGFAAVLQAAKEHDAFLMVKIHWNDGRPEQEERYAKQMEAAGVAGLVTRSHYTYVLRAADLLIAQGPSNMCLDAAILGTPSVYIQTEGFDYASALPRRAPADGIRREITWALEHPEPAAMWDEFASQYNTPHPVGGAAENVAAWVKELCGE